MHGTCSECSFTGQLRRSDLCGPCYQRHWRAGTLPPFTPNARAPRVTRDCECPGRPHRHGTRTAYVIDRCRCDACTEANRVAMAEREHLRNLARWHPEVSPFIAGDVVRAHLRELMAAGMGWKRIARAAGLGSSTVYPILYGKYVDNPLHPEHRPLRKKVRRDVAEKLLAVQLDLADGALVDGTGTRRRLQALVAMGWSQLRLARMIGFTQANFGTLIHGHTCVLRKTADAAVRIYSDCWRGPAVSTPRERGSVTAAKRLAASYGWAPPLAWDDDSIDDPNARPDLGEAPDGADARREDIRELLSYGDHPDSIPARLGMTPSGWDRWLDRNRDIRAEVTAARRAFDLNGHVRTGRKGAAA